MKKILTVPPPERRPLLVGMNQPVEDAEPLDPRVPRSSGANLLSYLQIFREAGEADFRRVFARTNVLEGPIWSPLAAKANARQTLETMAVHPCSVLLGAGVVKALGMMQTGVGEWRVMHMPPHGTLTYTGIPHPSGLNRIYNQGEVRRSVGRVLKELWDAHEGIQDDVALAEHSRNQRFG
jgi:hypothetical protein